MASAPTPSFSVVNNPPNSLLRSIAAFHNREASWGTTLLELSITNSTHVVARDDNNNLVACATFNTIPTNDVSWLGNVVVATHARRQGIATRMMSTVLQHAKSRKNLPGVIVLAATEMGVPIYKSLGFKSNPEIYVSVYVRSVLPPPPQSTCIPHSPDEAEHEQALDMDSDTVAFNRKHIIKSIYAAEQLCSVVNISGRVVAAAWGRISTKINDEKYGRLFIGPVVATSADFATAVVSHLIRKQHLNEGFSRRSFALVLERHGLTERNRMVFEALGYERCAICPYMWKQLKPESLSGTSLRLGLERSSPWYYALAGCDIS